MMPTTNRNISKKKLDTLDIRKKIKALKLLGEEKQLSPLTDTDITVFKKLLNKRNKTEKQEETFNDAAEKILHVFLLYDEVVNKFLQEGKFNREQLKVLVKKSYWQKIVEAYQENYDINLEVLDTADKNKISPIRKEHMWYAEQAILCLLDVSDFSNNTNFNNSRRIASLAEFDERYFKRPEVKQLLEKDQSLFTEVLNFYPTDHEISELKSKYRYVNHFFALFDYHRALPKIADTLEKDPDLGQGFVEPPFHDECSPDPRKNLSGSFRSPLSAHSFQQTSSPEQRTPIRNHHFEALTPLSVRSMHSLGSNASLDQMGDLSFVSSQGMQSPEEQEALEFQEANRNARALVLPNIVSPNRVSDRRKLAQIQRYFIYFLLAAGNAGYFNLFILDACLLNNEIEDSTLDENIDKNHAFDFLTNNRALFLHMLNLSTSENPGNGMDLSMLSKAIANLEVTKSPTFQKDLRSKYNATFSSEMVDPFRLEELVTQWLAYELNHNEQVYSRVFMALCHFEPKSSDENKRVWLNLLIKLSLTKPEYATKLLDRRYCFKWLSNQAKAYLETEDIKQILLGSRQMDASNNQRYSEAQISLVFSRRFFYLVKPDAMKFSGKDLIDLLMAGQSETLGRAISSNPYYLNKILNAFNESNSKGDTASITETLSHLLKYYPSVLECLENEYDKFKSKLEGKDEEVFVFPERAEISSTEQRSTPIKLGRSRRQTPIPSSHAKASKPIPNALEDVAEENPEALLARVTHESSLNNSEPRREESLGLPNSPPLLIVVESQPLAQNTLIPAPPPAPPMAPHITGPSVVMGNSLPLIKGKASQVAESCEKELADAARGKPEFLGSIASASSSFFNRHSLVKNQIKAALERLFKQHKIELINDHTEGNLLTFITKLQGIKSREAAVTLMHENLLMKDAKTVNLQEVQGLADDSFGSSSVPNISQSAPGLPEECSKAIVSELASEFDCFKTWAAPEEATPKQTAAPSLAALLSIRRQLMESGTAPKM